MFDYGVREKRALSWFLVDGGGHLGAVSVGGRTCWGLLNLLSRQCCQEVINLELTGDPKAKRGVENL